MKKFIRTYILHNFAYKITALLLAGIFWYIVQGEEVLEINRKIHVHLDVPENLLIKGSKVRIKDATISGPRAMLSQLSAFPLDATIRIPSNKTGKLRFRLDKEYIKNWNPKLKLVVHDAYIQVVIDEKQTRILTIKELLQGNPAEGYQVEKTTIEPDKVIITGMKDDITRLSKITTEPIDIAGMQKTTSLEVALNSSGIAPAQLSVEKVVVTITVAEKKITQVFKNIPLKAEEKLDDKILVHRLRPSEISVVLQGTPSVLQLVKPEDLHAYVSVPELLAGKYEKKVQVHAPADTHVIETSPAVVEVTISKK